MTDLKELWIGDRLFIQSMNTIGLFEGIDPNGLAIVKLKNKSIHIEAKFIGIADEVKVEVDLGLNEEEVTLQFDGILELELRKGEIDLHIEVLNPTMKNARVERILQYQIEQCKSFVEASIHRRKYSIIIIHGKGEGVLKMEVIHLLTQFKEVMHHLTVNNGGAQEVLFHY